MKKKLISTVLIFLTFLCGCSTPIKLTHKFESNYLTPEIIYSKNYQTGVPQESFIGDPVIKIRDWRVRKTEKKFITIKNDFELISTNMNNIILSFNAGRYRAIGKTTISGTEYFVIELPEFSGTKNILVTAKGLLYPKIATNLWFAPGRSWIIKPSETKLDEISNGLVVDKNPGNTFFELIYNGIVNDQIYLKYREYTRDGLAREAFFQDLRYDKENEIIRFKQIKLKIHEANSEHIVFTVIDDGLI